jgi:hypothetical protein
LPSPRRCPARDDYLHQKKDMSVEWLRIVSARTMLRHGVDVESK